MSITVSKNISRGWRFSKKMLRQERKGLPNRKRSLTGLLYFPTLGISNVPSTPKHLYLGSTEYREDPN